MGALEFRPARGPNVASHTAIKLGRLVESARLAVQGQIDTDPQAHAALAQIIQVGTSAGGARAKAAIAWNPDTNEIRAGQFEANPGFEHWLLKFDGMGADSELAHLSQQALQGLPDNRCLVMCRNDDCRHVDSISSIQYLSKSVIPPDYRRPASADFFQPTVQAAPSFADQAAASSSGRIFARRFTVSGYLATRLSNTFAGPVGSARPCSQFSKVRFETPRAAANSACDKPE